MRLEEYTVPFRAILFVFGLFTQLRQQLDACLDDNFALTCLGRNKYLSNQTNYFVIIWLGLFLYWHKDSQKLERLNGKIRGAITVYITFTWLAYWFLLSADDRSAGWDAYTNVVIHYIFPIAFIIDWILYERSKYEWGYLRSWSIYPMLYAIFALGNGSLGLHMGYIYSFIDVDENGWPSVLIFVLGIYVSFMLISAVYILANRRLVTPLDQDN